MKVIKLGVIFAVAFGISSFAQANTHIKIISESFMARENACDQFAGNWQGRAVVEKVCKYSGTATVSRGAAAGHYSVHVDLRPADFWCPKADPIDLLATCYGSDINIESPSSAHLSGTTDGSTVHLSGSVDSNGKSIHVDSLDLNK